MKIVIVSRNGEEKLRVPAEIRNGILRAGKNILINSDLIAGSGMSKEQVAAEIKSGRITPQIEAMGMRLGDNGNGLVCQWAEDVEREKAAKTFAARSLRVAKNGKLVIQHDQRDELGSEVELDGCAWRVESLGKAWSAGHYQMRYAYVAFARITDGSAAYKSIGALLKDEQYRHHRESNAMMDDEQNDGVNPPRPVCPLLQPILDSISTTDKHAVDLRRQVEAAANSDPSTTTGWIRGKYCKKALDLLNAGAGEDDVVSAMNGYKSDPDYCEAVAGM